MKRRLIVPALLALFLTCPASAWGEEAVDPSTPVPDAEQAFEKLKSLEGEWQGTTRRGNDARLTVQVIAGGHAVMEEFQETMGERVMSMHTIYHLDGDTLMLTHYCVSNNQPRMRADLGGLPEALRFEFLDATNLASPDAGHMHRAMIEFQGSDRIVNAWTYRKDGEDQYTETIEWERRR